MNSKELKMLVDNAQSFINQKPVSKKLKKLFVDYINNLPDELARQEFIPISEELMSEELRTEIVINMLRNETQELNLKIYNYKIKQ